MDRLGGLSAYTENFQRCLAQYTGGCALCTVYGYQNPKHSVIHCPVFHNELQVVTSRKFIDWQKSLSYQEKLHSKVCWKCHVPQCDDLLHSTFQKGEDCLHKDIIAPIGFGIFYKPTLKKEAQQHFNTHWMSIEVFAKWLNGPPVAGERTNLSGLFLWYTSRIVQG